MATFGNISYHILHEREERMEQILTTVGVGEVQDIFYYSDEQHGQTDWCITDTGILVVRNHDTLRVITMYALRVSQVSAIYKAHGYNRVPNHLMSAVYNNEKKRKFLFC